MTQYFYALGTERKGPVSLAELRAAPVTRATLVWHEGMPDWKSATEFAELSDLFAVQQPPKIPGIPGALGPGTSSPAVAGVPPASADASYGPPAQRPGTRRNAYDDLGGPPPKTWLVESILMTVLCCPPFGIVGIVNAAKVESRYYAGDIEQANYHSREAGKWTKIGLYVGIGLWALYFGAIFLGVTVGGF